ncbi:hypothetical protein JAAARDRAFT_193862 [Jaapia argillacea MUCL 33604]|uniref:Uncharacterized protein n=1 Tax=Jaapia argillacea MUCL 33604 TaxID=933084 RepID=A0A067Q248_9AGAM|nr:hypothetical protein JAAARDRAFT_193862 [Jaapia argillacea MUCL 33604]
MPSPQLTPSLTPQSTPNAPGITPVDVHPPLLINPNNSDCIMQDSAEQSLSITKPSTSSVSHPETTTKQNHPPLVAMTVEEVVSLSKDMAGEDRRFLGSLLITIPVEVDGNKATCILIQKSMQMLMNDTNGGEGRPWALQNFVSTKERSDVVPHKDLPANSDLDVYAAVAPRVLTCQVTCEAIPSKHDSMPDLQSVSDSEDGKWEEDDGSFIYYHDINLDPPELNIIPASTTSSIDPSLTLLSSGSPPTV